MKTFIATTFLAAFAILARGEIKLETIEYKLGDVVCEGGIGA